MNTGRRADHTSAPRIFTVLLSSPGDVRAEVDLADNVVREIDACAQSLGIVIRSWRYERNAPPGVAADAQAVLPPYIPEYDIYVGVMCSRIGTPTQHALSGTVDEFQDACSRRERTGRPAIFFYFCAEQNCCDSAQAAAVREFRARYPGLFREFHERADFAATLKHDLLLWLMHELSLARPLPTESTKLGVRIEDKDDRLLGKRARRVLQRLHDAFPLDEVLDTGERRDLAAAARCLEEDPGSLDLTPDLLETAQRITAGSREYLDVGASKVIGDEREHVLSCLLAIGILLECDRSGCADPSRNPPQNASLQDWLRFLTREIRLHRGGFVQYVLEAPSPEHINSLKRHTSLRLELLWQGLRAGLASRKLGVIVEPSEIVLSSPVRRVPAEILEALRDTRSLELRDSAALAHLGPSNTGEAATPSPVDLELLLPLVGATVSGIVKFSARSARTQFIEVRKAGSDDLLRFDVSSTGSIDLDTRKLEAGATYEWISMTTDALRKPAIDRAGFFIVATVEAERIREAISAMLPEQFATTCRYFGFHDDLMRGLWTRLASATTSMEERLWAYERVRSGFDFLLARYPRLACVETHRNAAGWVLSLLRKGELQ